MISELEIKVAMREHRPFLRHSYFTRPFKVADISGRDAAALHLTIMTASPGILDGDDYRIRVELEEGATLQLYTQSYQRIFNMQQGARQDSHVTMADGCSLVYLPHPSVPHMESVFEGSSHITLGKNCRLLWGEIITCGRKLNGEIFRCRKFQNIISIYKEGRLLFRDVTLLQPETVPATVIGQWEEYTHQASLLWYDEQLDMADTVYDLLSAEAGIAAGVSKTASGALLVRVLGQGGEQLYELFKKIARLAGKERKL